MYSLLSVGKWRAMLTHLTKIQSRGVCYNYTYKVHENVLFHDDPDEAKKPKHCWSNNKLFTSLVSICRVVVFFWHNLNGVNEDKTACWAASLSLQQKLLKLTDLLTNHVVGICIPMCQWLNWCVCVWGGGTKWAVWLTIIRTFAF